MALKRREKILAAAAAAVLLLLAGQVVLSGGLSAGGKSLAELRVERNKLADNVADSKKVYADAEEARKQLARWQAQSLPSRVDRAQSAYQNWLRELVERIGFGGCSVTANPTQKAAAAAYTMLGFRVQGDGTLDQLVQFLHEFYSAGHLHKIARLSIQPRQESDELGLIMTIEALSLPKADRADSLSQAPANRLKEESLSYYRRLINRRLMEDDRYVDAGGVFAAFEPKPEPVVERREPPPREPPRPPEPPRFDHLRYTRVTGIVAVDGRPQAWLLVQTTGQRKELFEGDSFEVEGARGRVLKITQHEVELEIDGEHRLVATGQNLREGLELPE